jgi:hypothetical protein
MGKLRIKLCGNNKRIFSINQLIFTCKHQIKEADSFVFYPGILNLQALVCYHAG